MTASSWSRKIGRCALTKFMTFCCSVSLSSLDFVATRLLLSSSVFAALVSSSASNYLRRVTAQPMTIRTWDYHHFAWPYRLCGTSHRPRLAEEYGHEILRGRLSKTSKRVWRTVTGNFQLLAFIVSSQVFTHPCLHRRSVIVGMKQQLVSLKFSTTSKSNSLAKASFSAFCCKISESSCGWLMVSISLLSDGLLCCCSCSRSRSRGCCCSERFSGASLSFPPW